MEVFMKRILTIAAASVLFGLAGYAAAEPATSDHANHNHAVPTAPAAPSITPAPSKDMMSCDHMKQEGDSKSGGMDAMSGMADKSGGSMDHQHMMDGDMKDCDHMKHGEATPSPTPKP